MLILILLYATLIPWNSRMQDGRYVNSSVIYLSTGKFGVNFVLCAGYFHWWFEISTARINIWKKVVQEVLKKIADGWRTNSKEATGFCLRRSSWIVGAIPGWWKFYLAWSIDILMEEFKNTQVIKVWDILPASKIPTLARELDAWFGKYTMDFMNRCKHKSFQGYV